MTECKWDKKCIYGIAGLGMFQCKYLTENGGCNLEKIKDHTSYQK